MSDWYIPDRADDVVHSLFHALHDCESEHIDNTGGPCDVGRNRDDCCKFCSTAEMIRGCLREMGVKARWKRDGDFGGETVVDGE